MAAMLPFTEIGQMDIKPAQNIQDSFLNTARKDKAPITIYLLSGVKLTGRIRSFDKYSVVLESNNQEQLIFKHAISTVVLGKGVHHAPMAGPANDRPGAASQSNSAAGGPTGATGTES
jgi:host factor-I protein